MCPRRHVRGRAGGIRYVCSGVRIAQARHVLTGLFSCRHMGPGGRRARGEAHGRRRSARRAQCPREPHAGCLRSPEQSGGSADVLARSVPFAIFLHMMESWRWTSRCRCYDAGSRSRAHVFRARTTCVGTHLGPQAAATCDVMSRRRSRRLALRPATRATCQHGCWHRRTRLALRPACLRACGAEGPE